MQQERMSACTYWVRERPLDETFALFSKAGFKKIDLWGGLPNFSLNPAECDVASLQTAAAAAGVRIANLGTYPGKKLLSPDPAEAKAETAVMRRAIDIAAELGARSIRVCPAHGEDTSIVERLVPFFKESAAYAATKRVYLGMENHEGSIARFPTVCADLIDRVGSPWFGVLFEPCNLLACKEDYKEAYRILAGKVTHVHVKDGHWVDGRFERVALGKGDIDIPWLLEALARDGYKGDFALEYEMDDPPIERGLPEWRRFFLNLA